MNLMVVLLNGVVPAVVMKKFVKNTTFSLLLMITLLGHILDPTPAME